MNEDPCCGRKELRRGLSMSTTAPPKPRIPGCGFLLQEANLTDVFAPEDFSEQHRLIAQTADDFCNNEIVPNADKMERKDFSVTRDLLKKAADLGLRRWVFLKRTAGLK